MTNNYVLVNPHVQGEFKNTAKAYIDFIFS